MKYFKNIFICFVWLISCKSKEVLNTPSVQESKPAPIWVSSRPNNGFKYVGIGFADKTSGNNFQMEAKKNALYDLASEIKVNISSNSVLYTVQNSNQFNESFNSLIKLSNTDNIEGYELIDSYENDKQYWVYYSLDKQAYADQKAKKKQQIILKASHLIDLAFQDEKNGDFSSSLKKRIQGFSILSPYLNEDITFDPTLSHGISTVFDLTNTIQQQLQSVSISEGTITGDLKPYQFSYKPLTYRLFIKNKSALVNFPFLVESDNEKVRTQEKSVTNAQGDLQVIVTEVEPINQFVNFSLTPDLQTLLGKDSISQSSINLLKQFVQTNSLKLPAKVSNLNVYLNVKENNFGKAMNMGVLLPLIQQKFSGIEINLVDKPDNADFTVEAIADTKEDVSSNVLEKNFNLKLAVLQIQLMVKNNLKNGESYSWQINDVYGFANSLENAGLNAYENQKLASSLAEALFFAKRKVIVY